jgi:hypothetical protein
VKAFSLFACLVALALVGCKGGEANLVGRWKGEIKLPEKDKNDPMAKMAEGFLSMLSFDLELKADHKYTMTVFIIPMEGTWAMSGNKVVLTPTLIMGMTPEEAKKEQEKQKAANPTMAKQGGGEEFMDGPLELEVIDGKTMKLIPPASANAKPGEGDFIFTKQNS